MPTQTNLLPSSNLSLRAIFRSYENSYCTAEETVELHPDGAGESRPIDAVGGKWSIQFALEPGPSGLEGTIQLKLRIQTVEPPSSPCAVGLELFCPEWSENAWALVPGAVYAGNRFQVCATNYSPRYPESEAHPRADLLITDVPRLERESGPSRLQLLSGDLTIPAAGATLPGGIGFLLVYIPSGGATFAQNRLLWEISENEPRSEARFVCAWPGVREKRYSFANREIRTDAESEDRGRFFSVGERVEMNFLLSLFEANAPQVLFDRLFAISNASSLWPRSRAGECELPFSAAAGLIEEKMNRDAWNESLSLFSTTADPLSPHYFQSGWCGGGINESALLSSPDEVTRRRAIRSLNTQCREGRLPNGFFYGKRRRDGRWTLDFAHDTTPHTQRWHLVRRAGDMLLYLQNALDHPSSDEECRSFCEAAVKDLSDVLCRVWEKEGQFGQFVDPEAESVAVGGSTSGGLIPAGLIRAAQRFASPRYRRVALEAAEHFYARFTRPCITTGGPGDALQAPDSESAAALVDGYLALFEAGCGEHWLSRAAEAARQFASWVVPYDFPFPAESEFGRLNIPTTGAVAANVQNKPAAPGICNHSGIFLLRLFRHTGEVSYLHLLRDIARMIPWTVSRPDRPIHDPSGKPLPSGFINERANMSDWDHNVGGVFYGSTWSEVAMLLTWVEVPGVYAQPDTGLICTLDHVQARWTDDSRAQLLLENPTRFVARVKILCETATTASKQPMPPGWKLPVVTIAAGESVVFDP